MKAKPGTWRRPARVIDDVVTAALLTLGAAVENRRPGNSHRAWLAAIPIIIVNYTAFRAQLRFWQAHLDRGDALLVSVALESIAVYLMWLAHLALLADDSALRLRLAAYGMALVIGALNYSHYCKPGWRPTVAAVTFGMMSVISPWLWSAYTRRISRDDLKAKNRIEDHAVRLGITRWTWHLIRSWKVMFRATWAGENRPAEAVRLSPLREPRLAGQQAADAASSSGALDQDGSGQGAGTEAPGTLPPPLQGTGTMPPPSGQRDEEPRRERRVPVRGAPPAGLTAANGQEAEVLARLIAAGKPLSVREISQGWFGAEDRCRAGYRVHEALAAALNGHGDPS